MTHTPKYTLSAVQPIHPKEENVFMQKNIELWEEPFHIRRSKDKHCVQNIVVLKNIMTPSCIVDVSVSTHRTFLVADA